MQNLDQTVFDSLQDNNCFAYLIPPTQTLNTTGFKVMQTLVPQGLVAAYRSSLNGQTRLVYDISDYEPLSALACCMTPAQFAQVARDLFRLFGKIRTNGFIRPENILLNQDQLMINQNMCVHLMYLPVDDSHNPTAKLASLDVTLRQLLVRFIEQNPNVRSERIARLDAVLKNPREPLSSAIAILNVKTPSPAEPPARKSSECRPLQLARIGGNRKILLNIPCNGAVVGRNPEKSSVILSDSSVSGAHCRLFYDQQHWFVEDLGSVNGTKLNGVRLASNQPAPFKPDDLIEISRYIFTVKEQEL